MDTFAVMDLNADVGEGGGEDAALFAAGITSANVACGAHAGDAATMAAACALAARHGVALGAHPGYADRENFGRKACLLTLDALAELIDGQLDLLGGHAAAAGVRIRHIKPHGALYHRLNEDGEQARRFVAVVAARVPGALVYGPPRGALRDAAEAAGVRLVPEGFIDRAYRADGVLVPRGEPGAVLHEEGAAVAQALALARSGSVHTLCVHGDGPTAARLLMAARRALTSAGVRLCAPAAGRGE